MTSPIKHKKITVIGDSIVDVYVYGTAIGKSAETPTIVARRSRNEISLGGAFLLVRNLLEIGASVNFITLVGSDSESSFVDVFEHPRLKKLIIRETGRRTTSKKRYWIDGYKLLQFDEFDNTPIKSDSYLQARSFIESSLQETELFLVSDYRHGLMSDDLILFCLQESKRQNIELYIDSQVSQSSSNHLAYMGSDLFVLNEKEAASILRTNKLLDSSVVFEDLSKILNCSKIIIKLGEHGSIGFINGAVITTQALKCDSIDTCGAGDAFFAMLAISDIKEPERALTLANRWAGLATTSLGANPPVLEDFIKRDLYE